MIRHLLTLAWRRRRTNALIAAEVGGSFLVLGILATLCAQLWLNWRRPMGFEARDAWTAVIHGEGDRLKVERLLAGARSSGDVLVAAGSTTVPYDGGEDSWQFQTERGLIDAEVAAVTIEAAEAWGLEIVAGRWFEDGDAGLSWRPVVVDRDFARALREDGDVVGTSLPRGSDEQPDMRIVGVISDFRRKGELSPARPYFMRLLKEDAEVDAAQLVLRMRPGTPAAAEPALLETLRAAAPSAQVTIRRLEDLRADHLRTALLALGAGGVVAAFLLAMVALGLLGVLWQNVARRTRELGLRRALGATPSDVRLLVVGEVAVVAAAALAAGTLLALQVPLLAPIPGLSGGALALGLAASAAIVSSIVLACSAHPGSLAMRVPPAEALRQE